MFYRFISVSLTMVSIVLLELMAFGEEFSCRDTSQPPVQQSNETQVQLEARIRELEGRRCISLEQLQQKKIQRLKETAADIRIQRQSTGDFQAFFSWMSTNLAGYNKYIQAGSYAAVLAKALPIPYAGQASVFAKFIAQFTIALNNASVAISNYHTTTQRYLALMETLEKQAVPDVKTATEAEQLAVHQLVKDIQEAQTRLVVVSDLSSGALSFLESLNHYVSETDEYWNKVKGAFRKNVDPKEKSYLSESTDNLRNQASRFNAKLKSFDELGKKEIAGVKSLATYNELISLVTTAK